MSDRPAPPPSLAEEQARAYRQSADARSAASMPRPTFPLLRN